MTEKSLDEIRAADCGYLRTEMPSRLRRLTEILSAGAFAPESAWCGDVFLKLMQSAGRVGADLLAAIESPEAVPAVAWNARNMVELSVWIHYCGQSETNARRFYEDALRDMKGLVLSLGQINKFVGNRFEQEQSAHETLDHIALTQLGLDLIDADYASVSSAATAAGLSGWYLPTNKFLSKFAHPTALLVIGVAQKSEMIRDMQLACFGHGIYAAHLCEVDLQRMAYALTTK
jgi:hypothetical protein